MSRKDKYPQHSQKRQGYKKVAGGKQQIAGKESDLSNLRHADLLPATLLVTAKQAIKKALLLTGGLIAKGFG